MQAQKAFPPKHQPTLGTNFVVWDTKVDSVDIKLIIADTGSQERFEPVLPKYFQGSLAFAFIFDLTNKSTFVKLDYWMELVEKAVKGAPRVLVGNKVDLKDKRVISEEEAKEYAKEKGIKYFEVSAKENINLDEVFKCLVSYAYERDKSN